jgi:type VI secretion system protein ImpF
MDAFPLVKDLVLNYGVPDLSGQTASTLNAQEIEAGIRRAILLYEPRILRHGLRIKIHSEQNDISANNLIFEIEGTVFGQPAPFQIILQSEMDLENGSINLKDQ